MPRYRDYIRHEFYSQSCRDSFLEYWNKRHGKRSKAVPKTEYLDAEETEPYAYSAELKTENKARQTVFVLVAETFDAAFGEAVHGCELLIRDMM